MVWQSIRPPNGIFAYSPLSGGQGFAASWATSQSIACAIMVPERAMMVPVCKTPVLRQSHLSRIDQETEYGWLCWLVFGSKEPPSPTPELRPVRSAETSGSVEPLHIARGRGYTVEVVGEVHRQDALNAICGGKCEDGHDLKTTAQLLLIDDNPYDPNAVGVFINSELVGYIPRDAARHVRAEVIGLSPDERPVTCDAKIVGGWDRGDGDEGHYGVKLSLSNPMRLA